MLRMFNKGYYNCLDANIAMLAKNYDKSYHYLFGSYLYFDIRQNYKTLGLNILPYYEINKFQVLEQYHGFQINIIEYDKIHGAFNEFLFKYKTVVIETDVYNCRWSKLFKKSHNTHYLILTYKNKNECNCYDPYFLKDVFSVSLTSLYISGIICTVSGFHDIENKGAELCHLIVHIGKYKRVLQQKCIYTALANNLYNLDIKAEIEGEFDVNNIVVLRKLKQIADNRQCYKELLYEVSGKYGITFEKEYKILDDTYNEWLRFRMILLKSIYQNSLSEKTIEAILSGFKLIIEKELTFLQSLENKLTSLTRS